MDARRWWCVWECIKQILTVSDRDRGRRSAAFWRLSLDLLWQFQRSGGPAGHGVRLCLSRLNFFFFLNRSPSISESFFLNRSRTDHVSLYESTASLLVNHSVALQLNGTTERLIRKRKMPVTENVSTPTASALFSSAHFLLGNVFWSRSMKYRFIMEPLFGLKRLKMWTFFSFQNIL